MSKESCENSKCSKQVSFTRQPCIHISKQTRPIFSVRQMLVSLLHRGIEQDFLLPQRNKIEEWLKENKSKTLVLECHGGILMENQRNNNKCSYYYLGQFTSLYVLTTVLIMLHRMEQR